MKWLFSVTYYAPYVSGLTIYVQRLAEELAKKGDKSTVVCMKHDKALKREEVSGGVRIKRAEVIGRISKGFISADWVIKTGREVMNADIVVVNLPQAEGWIPAVWARIWGRKLIAVYHCEVEMPNKIIRWGLEQANWLVLELADRIVTYTADYAESSRLLRKYADKVETVYPPLPQPGTDKSLEGELRSKVGSGPVVGVAARLAREKGIEYLIEALPKINQRVKIAIAGPTEPIGEKTYKAEILKLVEQYKNRIVFLGTIKPEKMGAFYKVIDLLALPSINSTEAFGMVQAEAMMMGVPVVASDLPGVRVPIKVTGMGLIVPPKNSTALAEVINLILKNKAKYTAALMKIKQEFDISKTLAFWEELGHEI